MINIEAFARKTPVIARDLGALPEVIQDSGGGFVYRTDEELLASMERIAGSPELRAELGQRGYCAFLRWWCRDAHLQLYFDFLNSRAMKKFGGIPWQ
jgi:glycosyltransferase involved in cell wall biosynthesis